MVEWLQALLYLLQGMVGAALFSFVNVVAWRLPRNLPIVKGHSACPVCGARLTALDLVPVFSWVILRGKCRHCGAPISVRYLLMELAGGGFALACVAKFGFLATGPFGFSWPAALVLVLGCVLAAVSLVDAETQTIPNSLVVAVAVCGVASLFVFPEISLVSHLIGALVVSLPMFVVCLFVPGGFGGGDIKLMAAAGLFLGWQQCLVATFFAILGGGLYAIWLLATKKKGKADHFAFGPFLCGGILFALFFGQAILTWYCRFL